MTKYAYTNDKPPFSYLEETIMIYLDHAATNSRLSGGCQ